MAAQHINEEIMRKPRVLATIGMGNTWLYDEIKNDRFPKPIKLGVRAVGWKKSEVLAWIKSRETHDTEAAEAAL